MSRRLATVLFPSLALYILAATTGAGARAGEAPRILDEKAALAYSQEAIGRRVGDFAFVDSTGQAARSGDFRGKPLVVNMVYTACYHTCPLIVQTLYRAVEAAQHTFGAEGFTVVTIGFDSENDTPARMRAFARTQGVNLPSWRFLTADRATIKRLAADIGFVFFPSPRGFDHLAQTTIIDADGLIYRHIYGSDFGPPALVEPLKDLVYGRPRAQGTLSGLIDRIRLFCTLYDPRTERYRFSYSVFIGIAIGFMILATVAVILIRGWWRQWRLKQTL
ncbi:MAG: SCO family protein [Alphaproteobacteria bacterium]